MFSSEYIDGALYHTVTQGRAQEGCECHNSSMFALLIARNGKLHLNEEEHISFQDLIIFYTPYINKTNSLAELQIWRTLLILILKKLHSIYIFRFKRNYNTVICPGGPDGVLEGFAKKPRQIYWAL